MPKRTRSIAFILTFFSFAVVLTRGAFPINAEEVLKFDAKKLPAGSHFPEQVRKTGKVLESFYKKTGRISIWFGTDRMEQLVKRMRAARVDGLNPEDYPIDKLRSFLTIKKQVKDKQSRAIMEIWFSTYFLQYTSDLKLGRFKPRKVDPGLHWRTKTIDRQQALQDLSVSSSLDAFFDKWQVQSEAYVSLKRALARYRKLQKNGGWPRVSPGPVLKPGMTSSRVAEVRNRLNVTDEKLSGLFVENLDHYGVKLEQTVKEFQKRHGIDADGVIGPATLKAMNVSVKQRVRQIILSMERWRWMPEDYGSEFIAVNIARYELFHIKNKRLLDRIKVVVGLPYHKTPVFSDKIKYLEFNPYWNVPYSIATKEMLPKLKKNSASLASSFEVLRGNKIVNPVEIDWSQYSGRNFPFRIRQKPGPKNALGRVKFMFPNRFNVYLHDTPARSKFDKTKRAFSHGCVRVNRPIDLAEQLLRDVPGWGRKKIDAVLATGKRTIVNLAKPMKVHIIYSTAWAEGPDTIYFGPDIYGRDKKLSQILFGAS